MPKTTKHRMKSKIKVAHVHAPKINVRSQDKPAVSVRLRVQTVRLRKPINIRRE